jgi:hypothetical protein
MKSDYVLKENVKAEQFNGQEIEGITVVKPFIVHSRDGKLFYVSSCEPLPTDWLSKEKQEDGKYIAYPFMCYEIKSNPETEDATEDHDLVKLYFEMFPGRSLYTHAYIKLEGPANTKTVRAGDWVVKYPSGKIDVVSDDEFRANFI